jgi:hypothetical protein
MNCSARARASSIAPKTSKSTLFRLKWARLIFQIFSTQCARKPSAEAFPKNFALIRLAEKTMQKQQQQVSEEKKKEEIASLEAQISQTT